MWNKIKVKNIDEIIIRVEPEQGQSPSEGSLLDKTSKIKRKIKESNG